MKKANCTLGFLRRNLPISNTDTKAAAYSALVRPTLEYYASVWSPHTKQSKHKLDMVQKMTARYCTNRYHNTSSMTEMLGDLQWETLESRRKKIKLIMLFKIVNDLVDILAEEYLSPASTHTRALHSKKLRQYPAKSDTFKYSFFPRIILAWNTLPPNIAEAPDLVHFR